MNRQKWTCLVFVVLILGIAAVNLFIPSREFSENENRPLEQMPKVSVDMVISGQFTSKFDTYANDQFVFRDGWVGLKTLSQLALLKKDNQRVFFGKGGYLFEVESKTDDEKLKKNAQAVSAFMKELKSRYPSVYSSVMIAPTAEAVLPEKLPPLAPVNDQKQMFQTVMEMVGDSSRFINPFEALQSASEHQQVYFRTDHHWTAHGAYAAYTAWTEAVDLNPLESGKFNVKTVSNAFYGTTYSKANLYTIHPDMVEIYEPVDSNPCSVVFDNGKSTLDSLYDWSFLEKKDKYSLFVGGNHALAQIDTGVHNGKHLLLIKDSYAHAFVPFLSNHFESITMVDLRYYKSALNTLMKENSVTDVLLLYNMTNFSQDSYVGSMLKWK